MAILGYPVPCVHPERVVAGDGRRLEQDDSVRTAGAFGSSGCPHVRHYHSLRVTPARDARHPSTTAAWCRACGCVLADGCLPVARANLRHRGGS